MNAAVWPVSGARWCKICRQNLSGNVFAFCSDCGDLLCISCAAGNYKERTIQSVLFLLVATYTKYLTLRFPKCHQCLDSFVLLETAARKKLWRDTAQIASVLLGVLAGTFGYMSYALNPHPPDFGSFSICVVLFLIASVIMGYLVAGFFRDNRRNKLNREKPYLNNLSVTCPVCGANSENAMFETQNEIEKGGGVLDWLSGFVVSKGVPDAIHCPACGYFGPAAMGFGLRIHVARYGPSLLNGTFWAQHGWRAYQLLPQYAAIGR